MAPLIRPELVASVRRWREALTGGAILLAGVWWALTASGLLRALGVLLVALGTVALAAGIQRGRFRRTDAGPGVVAVVEGQLSYFGPLSGGVMAMAAIREVGFDPSAHPSPVWVLGGEGGPLFVPVNALGAEALFDVFAGLPGLSTERVLATLDRPPERPVTLWRRPAGQSLPPPGGPRPTLH